MPVTVPLERGYQGAQMTDGMLVQRAIEGDARAFASLVDRHAGACLRYATRMLGTVEDAEDVTQEALFRAYGALDRYDRAQPFRTWLMAILINRCRSAMLYRHRREERVQTYSAGVQLTSTPAPSGAIEAREAIARAVVQLEPDQREAFLLRHVEDLSYEEMAAVTGAGVSALKMRVKRACDRLRELLGDDHAG
jgi:RNA polymerase sigma-70 factor (ECF subfamily)